MAQAVQGIRNIVVYGNPPSFLGFFLLLTIGMVTYVLGYEIIRSLDKEYAKIS